MAVERARSRHRSYCPLMAAILNSHPITCRSGVSDIADLGQERPGSRDQRSNLPCRAVQFFNRGLAITRIFAPDSERNDTGILHNHAHLCAETLDEFSGIVVHAGDHTVAGIGRPDPAFAGPQVPDSLPAGFSHTQHFLALDRPVHRHCTRCRQRLAVQCGDGLALKDRINNRWRQESER